MNGRSITVILGEGWGFPGFPHSSVDKESACNAEDPGLIPGSGRSTGEGIGYPLQYSWASIVAQLVKKSACNVGDLGSIPGLGRSPGEGKGYPLQYSGLENSMDYKGSDERLSLSLFTGEFQKLGHHPPSPLTSCGRPWSQHGTWNMAFSVLMCCSGHTLKLKVEEKLTSPPSWTYSIYVVSLGEVILLKVVPRPLCVSGGNFRLSFFYFFLLTRTKKDHRHTRH